MARFGPKTFFQELRRRHVFNTVAIYIAGAWMALEAADLGFPGLNIPESAIRYVWMGAFLLLPLVVVLGWRYDISTQRITRTAAADEADDADVSLSRFDHLLIGSLGTVAIAVVGVMLFQIQRVELDQDQVQAVSATDNSIAVMPLSWCTDNPGEDALAGGIHTAVIDKLAAYHQLKVKSRSWVYKMVESNLSPAETASLLPVQYLLNGELCQDGQDMVMRAELTDHEHSLIWNGRFRQSVNDLGQVEQPLATLVAQGIAVELGEVTAISYAEPVNVLALKQLRIGQAFILRGEGEKARAALEEALEREPDFAEALYELALVTEDLAQEGQVGSIRKARPIAENALAVARAEIERGVADYKSHQVIASILYVLSDWEQDLTWRTAAALTQQQIAANKATARSMIEEAAQHMRKAIDLNRSKPELRKDLAQLLGMLGIEYRDEAFEIWQQLRIEEPLDVKVVFWLAEHLSRRGQYHQAIEELEWFEVLGEVPRTLRWQQLQIQSRNTAYDDRLELLLHMMQYETEKMNGLILGHLYWSVSTLVRLDLHQEAEALYQSLSAIPDTGSGWVRQFSLEDSYRRVSGRAEEVAREKLAEIEGMSNEEILDEFYLEAAWAADAFMDIGETERAVEIYEALALKSMDEAPSEWKDNLIAIYMATGRATDAEPLLDQTIRYLEDEYNGGVRNSEALGQLAQAYAVRGQDEEALKMLRLAVNHGYWVLVDDSPWTAIDFLGDPWQALRDDPRFIRQEQRAQARANQMADNIRTLLATHDIDALLVPVIEMHAAALAAKSEDS